MSQTASGIKVAFVLDTQTNTVTSAIRVFARATTVQRVQIGKMQSWVTAQNGKGRVIERYRFLSGTLEAFQKAYPGYSI
jgi:hypothetical protein